MQNAYRAPSSFGLFPPVVKNLLIINGLFFLGQQIPPLSGLLYQWGALWPAGTPDTLVQGGEVVGVPQFYAWQLVTSAFLHGGFGHILFNMFGLWMFGAVVERRMGSQRFLGFYLVCVLGASLLQLGITSWPYLVGSGGMIVPTLGASGGVLGVLAAFGVLYPEERIFLLFLPVPIPAKWFVLGYAAFSLFAGYSGVQAGVAHFAHLGGMVTGALLVLYWLGRLPVKPSRRLA